MLLSPATNDSPKTNKKLAKHYPFSSIFDAYQSLLFCVLGWLCDVSGAYTLTFCFSGGSIMAGGIFFLFFEGLRNGCTRRKVYSFSDFPGNTCSYKFLYHFAVT